MALTTQARVLEELGLTGASSGVTDYVDQLILIADASIGRYCGRFNATTGAETFSQGSRDERYSGRGTDKILLKNTPATAVSAVSLIDDSGTETTLASTEYRLSSDSQLGVLRRLGGVGTEAAWDRAFANTTSLPASRFVFTPRWPEGFENVRVQYTGGYATIPDDLEYVATRVVAEMYRNRRENNRAQSDSVDGQGVGYRSVDEIVRRFRSMLSPYRVGFLG